MGLCRSASPATAMSAAAASSRDNGTAAALNSGGTLTANGDTAPGQGSESASGVDDSTGGGGGSRVLRKRRHTCPDPRQWSPPLENGWHGEDARLSPPLRLGSRDPPPARKSAAGSRRSSEGDGSSRVVGHYERPAKLARLELCLKREVSDVKEGKDVVSGQCEEKPPVNNGDGLTELPVEVTESEPKQEPPDRTAASPSTPTPPPPPGTPPPPPPPPVTSAPAPDTRRRNVTEMEKLFLHSECHKTEILSSKLRHTAGRLSGAVTVTGQPPVLLPNGDEPGGQRRRKVPVPRPRQVRCVDSPATDSESDGPPHLEPEAPLGPTPRGAAVGPRRGSPAPQLREAESEADAVSFSFQSAPDVEEWFRTFSRQEAGRPAVEDFSWAAAGGGQRLPYQMSLEELFPRDLVPCGGQPRPLKPPTLPDRWLPPLPAAAAGRERSAGDSAPPADWLRLEELCQTLHRAADCPEPTELEPPPSELTAALAAWPGHSSLQELAEVVTKDSFEPLLDWPAPASPASGPSRPPDSPASGPSRPPDSPASESSRPPDSPSESSRPPDSPSESSRPSSADDTSSVSTDASAGGTGGRRRPFKRRKNRTGWPRARVKKPNLLKTAVSRAAAEAGAGRDGAAPS